MPLIKVYGAGRVSHIPWSMPYASVFEETELARNISQALEPLPFRDHVDIVEAMGKCFTWDLKQAQPFLQIETGEQDKCHQLVVALLPLGLDIETSPLGQYFLGRDYKEACVLLQAARAKAGQYRRMGLALMKVESAGYPAGKTVVFMDGNQHGHVHIVRAVDPAPTEGLEGIFLATTYELSKAPLMTDLPEPALALAS